MKFTIVLFLLLTIVSLSACNLEQKPTLCSEFDQLDYRSLEFGELEVNDVTRWLSESSYKDAKIGRERKQHDDVRTTLSWEQDGRTYSADFRDGILVRIDILWEKETSPKLTGSDILTCLGEPAVYQAFYGLGPEQPPLKFSLWYPDRGIRILALHSVETNEPPIVDGDVEIDLIGFVFPQSPELMVEDMYPYGYFEEVREEMVGRLKPWPGSWENIEIDER